MDDCIFCKVVAGEIPAAVLYEDDHVMAFDDISPQAPVHTLIIPKTHVDDLSDPALSSETACAMMAAVPAVASLKGISESGYRVIVNNGPDANQTVKHLHIHIMGGREMAHGMVTFSD